jgi:threonine aldolase
MAEPSPENTPASPPRQSIDLSIFEPPRTSAERLQRTADYARDPLAYLESTIGAEAVSSRRALLSIPDAVPLQNDFYGTGAHKDRFEAHVAALFGKRHALFFGTGVQAQSVACKIHGHGSSDPVVAWHASAHPEGAEQSGVTALFGLRRVLLGGDADALPRLADVEALAALPEGERPAVILLEVPNSSLNCDAYAFSELADMSRACRAAGVAFHCDGARIWEVGPYYQATHGKSMADVAALFDSVYVSFYKGLGGAAGAMLLSNDDDFMLSARIWQRRAGGNPYTSAYELIDCERGFNENVGTFEAKFAKAREIVEGITSATEKFRADGKAVVEFRPEAPKCCIVLIYLHGYSTGELHAARDRVLQRTGVKVFDTARAVGRKRNTLDEIFKEKWRDALKTNDKGQQRTNEPSDPATEEKCLHRTVQFLSNPELWRLDARVFIDGWVNLCEELAPDSQTTSAE